MKTILIYNYFKYSIHAEMPSEIQFYSGYFIFKFNGYNAEDCIIETIAYDITESDFNPSH